MPSERDFMNELGEIKKLLRLILLAQGSSVPTTAVAETFSGDSIGSTNRYLELYRNQYDRLIAIKVTGDFVLPGSRVSLALSPDPANTDKIDELSSTGKVISETIWLKPAQILYINSADTAFTLNGAIFRVLLFDGLGYAAG
jgi:hypothetical protein